MTTSRGWLWVARVTLLCTALGAVGCSKREAPSFGASAAAPPVATVPVPEAPTSGGEQSAFRVGARPAHVVTVDVTITVADVDAASRRLRDETARVEGFVANMTGGGEGTDRRASFELRVPAASAPAFRTAIAGLGTVSSEQERVEDVTEERADRTARLANARAEEKRLLDLLSQRTGSLADVLSAERELARVRETIERFEAQASALEGKIAFATVRVTLAPRVVTFSEAPLARVGAAFHQGVHDAGVVVLGLTVAAAQLGPTLIVLLALFGLGFLGVRSVIRARSRLAAR